MAWRNAYKLQDNQEQNCRLKEIERMSEDGTFDVLPKERSYPDTKRSGRNLRRTLAESKR